jgi:3-phenylpropionate/trans-cinnamate dioxygenase ferredoxin reductase subunit
VTRGTIIIGAGHAGGEAAIQLRKAGYGAPITIIGDEPHAPYERPPLSKDLLAGAMEPERLFLRPHDFYASHAIGLKLGIPATAIHRETTEVELANGERAPYDALILATGARARRLPIAGAELGGIHVIRTIEDTEGLSRAMATGRRLVLVGGGYIGLEAAAVAAEKGLQVTVLEAAGRLLARSGSPQIAEHYHRLHEGHGVRVLTGQSIAAFEGDGQVSAVRMADGARHPADIVVIGVGVSPNTELAERAGLTVKNGIVVDECCRTADAAIHAIGDVSAHPSAIYRRMLRLESVPNAMAQARVAARAIAGQPEPYNEVPWFWSTQYDVRLQIAGVRLEGDRAVLRGDMASGSFAVAHMREGRLAALEAVNNPRDFMAAKKLIAAGTVIDPEKLADAAVPLKDLL